MREKLSLYGTGIAVLIIAVAVRLTVLLPQTTRAAVTESSAATETEEATYPVMYYTPPTHKSALVSAQDAPLVQIVNRAEVPIDVAALLEQPLRYRQSQGPKVLIVHTHATEAYLGTDDYHSTDPQQNVVRVGQELCDRLNALGIETVHDTDLNDLDGYTGAYEHMADGIAQYLQRYPSIEMVIDVHRDAVEDDSGAEIALTGSIDGVSAAKLLLVMGTDAAGMEHPNWRDNLACAVQIQALCEKNAPGIFRDMSLRSQRYNQHLTANSILLEVGTAGNTLQEALVSIDYFAQQLALLLSQTD